MNVIQLEGLTEEEFIKHKEILQALIKSGGLSGVRGGVTEIHFDAEGNFKGVKLNYWTWKKRST